MFGPENGQKEAPDNRALKEQFLDSLASIGANVLSLREAVLALTRRGYRVSWCVGPWRRATARGTCAM